MKALELTVHNINKLLFIYKLGSYCIIQAEPIVNNALQEDMQALWDSAYLFRPIKADPIIDNIIKTPRWDETFVGLHIESVDVLRAVLIQSIEYPCVFFDNNPENIEFWTTTLIATITEYGLTKNPIQRLFAMNKKRITYQNRVQVWWREDVTDFDDGLSAYKVIVTGTQPILNDIYDTFLQYCPEDIGMYHLFSFCDDAIKWIDI